MTKVIEIRKLRDILRAILCCLLIAAVMFICMYLFVWLMNYACQVSVCGM